MLDRHDLADGPVGKHHATRVNAEVPRVGEYLLGEVDDGYGNVVVVAREHRAPALDLLAPGILLAGRVAESSRHVAHGALRPVRDDVRNLRGVATAVLLEDVLDHLFAPVRVKVDVDVGLFIA